MGEAAGAAGDGHGRETPKERRDCRGRAVVCTQTLPGLLRMLVSFTLKANRVKETLVLGKSGISEQGRFVGES